MSSASTATTAPMALATGPANAELYCTTMAVVNVSNRICAKAPYSASKCSPTSRAPPLMAYRSWGTTTLQNTRALECPSERATSSRAGSSRRSVARAGIKQATVCED